MCVCHRPWCQVTHHTWKTAKRTTSHMTRPIRPLLRLFGRHRRLRPSRSGTFGSYSTDSEEEHEGERALLR
jgi:hypothetical protein